MEEAFYDEDTQTPALSSIMKKRIKHEETT